MRAIERRIKLRCATLAWTLDIPLRQRVAVFHYTAYVSFMILPKSNRLTPEQVAEVTAIVAEFGCRIQPIVGAVRTIYAIVGDERDELMINRLEGLPMSSGSTGSSRRSS
jgi:hypothetical protein